MILNQFMETLELSVACIIWIVYIRETQLPDRTYKN